MNNNMVNVWSGTEEEKTKWRAQAEILKGTLYERAMRAEGMYGTIKPFLGFDAPNTLKQFLQLAVDTGQDDPSRLSPYLQTKRRHNEKYAQSLEDKKVKNWELRKGGVLQENAVISKVNNFLMDIAPTAINEERIKIEFEGTGTNRKLKIKLDEDKIVGDISKEVRALLPEFVEMSASNISGTGRMKKLQTLSKITPNIAIEHTGSGEQMDDGTTAYTNQDFSVKLGINFHYGKDSSTGYAESFRVQNKAAASYKPENKYKAVMRKTNVKSYQDIPKMLNSTFKHQYGSQGDQEGVVGVFCVGGKILYGYEILEKIINDITVLENAQNWEGLQDYLTYKD